MNIARKFFMLVQVTNVMTKPANAYYSEGVLYLGSWYPNMAKWTYGRVIGNRCEAWLSTGWNDVSDLENHPWSPEL